MSIGALLARFLSFFHPQQGALVQAEAEQEAPIPQPEEKQVEKGGASSDGATPAPAIQAHILITAKFYPTPNTSAGPNRPEYLINHWTANGSVAETIRWFQNAKSKASAHIIIGRDGELVQMVSFDCIAWHAGESVWQGRPNLNRMSIGVELVNWGPITYSKGRFLTWTKKEVDPDEVVQLPAKDGRLRWWHKFTEEQLEVAFNVEREIYTHYNLTDVLGHYDVSPGRKSDPGPAFPMEALRLFVQGEYPFRNKDGKTILR